MATIEIRRPAPALRPEGPRGPGGSFDSLTWVGYASLVAAFGFLVFGLRPIAEMGEPRQWDWQQLPSMIISPVRSAAVLLLPAALEFGVPGARRVTPWLMRGTVLLALEELLRPLLRAAQTAFIDGALTDSADSFSYAQPGWVALALCAAALTIVGMAGAWSLSDGLSDAGGRPARRLLLALVAGGTGILLITYGPMLAVAPPEGIDASQVVLLVSDSVSLALSFVDNALWLVIAARLIAGAASARRPRRAWAIGAVAGAGMLVVRLASPVLYTWVVADAWIGYAFLITGTLSLVLLAVAFAAGLGRGRVRRRPRPRRMRLFVLNPTS